MRYDIDRAVVTMSVRELCERAFPPSNLDLRPGMRGSLSSMQAGTACHKRVQAAHGLGYTPEVPFCNTTEHHGLLYEVSGRADGIFLDDIWTVDEIKSVSDRAFSFPPLERHMAQLRIYAYFLCVQKDLDEAAIRLTHVKRSDEELRFFTKRVTREELKAFYHDLLSRVEYRAQVLFERETHLRPSVASARFPYSALREGQELLIKECYRDIRAGKRLFAEAPTGIGKTVSTLYPAARALGEGHIDKIFYLTAKASTRREAFGAAAAIFRAGAHLRTMVLSARDQVCANPSAKVDPFGVSRHCNPDSCPYAKGFFDRLPSALCELLSRQSGYRRSTIEEVAKKYQICPYEFSLELSELCDIVICDYNYVFDPAVYLRRYFAPDADTGERYAFLIDEAHNLCDRARDMYSVSLGTQEIAEVYRTLQPDSPLLLPLEKLQITMQGFRRLCLDNLQKDEDGVEHGYYVNHALMEEFSQLVIFVRRTLEKWCHEHREDPSEAEVNRLCSSLGRFEVICEYFDRSFLTFIELAGDERTIKLVCLDPSRVLNARMERAHASVLFSATLNPPDYFADILGGGKHAVRISLPSPFDPENLCLTAITGISTRYEDREKSYSKLVSVIAATVSGKRGNYIVYFPSYDYMEAVAARFARKYPSIPLVLQSRGMNQEQKEAFLDSFLADSSLRIGFCVLGGSFSEGVDLPGKRLIGTVIVGTGLPGLSNERNILRDHYESTRERGYDYAYLFPGMNRVEQAAGRVIRREEDRGVVVLVDDRYADPRLRSIFPEHWSGIEYAGNASELAEIVACFWSEFQKNQ